MWEIYFQCTAGGSAASDLDGELKNVTFFLDSSSGTFELDRDYSWIKCNNDFKGFYLTAYTTGGFKKFSEAVEAKPEVISKKV